MEEYKKYKKELLSTTKKYIKPLPPQELVLPEIKDLNGNVVFSKKKLSTLNFKKPLTISNDIVSTELYLKSIERKDTRNFEIKISNQGSIPCYNAKWVLFKQESTELVRKISSEKFTIGIDEEKKFIVNTNEDINGTYYAIVYDPIMDSFPFGYLKDLIKNQLPNPSLNNSGWTTHTPIGNTSISTQSWDKSDLLMFRNFGITPPIGITSSELKYKLIIPDFLKSSVKKNKVSIRFGSNCLTSGIIGHPSHEGKIKLNFNNTSEEFLLKSTNGTLMSKPKKNVFGATLSPDSNELIFFLQAIKTSTSTPTNNSNFLPKSTKLYFTNINLHFEHRQMKQYPEIKITN